MTRRVVDPGRLLRALDLEVETLAPTRTRSPGEGSRTRSPLPANPRQSWSVSYVIIVTYKHAPD